MMNTSVKAIHCFLEGILGEEMNYKREVYHQKIATSLTSPLTCPGFMLATLFESL